MNINTMTFALNPKPFGNSSGESQRDSATKPRVARDELPWVKVAGVSQPQRGCGLVALPLPLATTLSGLSSIRRISQGSSFLATLGFVAESLWDSMEIGFVVQIKEPGNQTAG